MYRVQRLFEADVLAETLLRVVKTRLHLTVMALATVLIAIGLWANMTMQSTAYGTSGGRFADQVDSSSEYKVRNTVLNHVIGTEIRNGSLITTKGYAQDDYAYYPDQIERYNSNLGVQVEVYKLIARQFPLHFAANSDAYFSAFRFLNCLLLATCFAVFFTAIVGRTVGAALLAFAMSTAGGIALFASNLYFMTWLLFTPLLAFPLLLGGRRAGYVAAAFVSSLAYFGVRYEFATTFALLWLLPCILAYQMNRQPVRIIAALAFAAVCAGFAIMVVIHHLSVSIGQDVSFGQASDMIFKSLNMRVASLTGVPVPFSPLFLLKMFSRWSWTGFSLPFLFSVSKFVVLAGFVVLCAAERSGRWLPVAAWAAVAYLSWYIFAYQHIMLHTQYDSLIFAATIELALVAFAAMKMHSLGIMSRVPGRDSIGS